MGSGQKITEKASKLTLLFESAALNALSAIKSLMGGEFLQFLDKARKALSLVVREFQEKPAQNSTDEVLEGRGNLLGSGGSQGWISQDV